MGNPKELRNARQRLHYATVVAEAIERLPRRKGAMIQWGNGVIWRRVGDDSWEPLHDNENYESRIDLYGTYPSAHVASNANTFSGWTVLKRLPKA